MGFVHHTTLRCIPTWCSTVYRVYGTTGPRATLTEKPYKGWRFAGWRGSCKGNKQTCAVNLPPSSPSHFLRFARVRAAFTR
jgi:hypothetical protein